ncbi:MAG: serine hydrolase [Hungatella sp.]
MKRWKKLFCMAMAACLFCSVPTRAEVIVPPIPIQDQTLDQASMPQTESTIHMPQTEAQKGPGVEKTEAETSAAVQPETPILTVASIAKPEIAAQGAVLMDAATGRLLYEKNGETRYYPASITKLMTALLVIEHCNLDEVVTFSTTATTNLEEGAVSLKITTGDKLTVRQSLYALLLKSANEVANGLAEHVSGSVSGFAALMNQKAQSLGCTNTNFANPHGLNNSNHYTTPHDMARIARAAFQNDTLRQINNTLSYEIPATKLAPARTITIGHKMMYPSDSRYYPGIMGGKTGYTSLAGNTLVTGAERGGVRLIAVIMKSKSTQYTDTKALLDYGFALTATAPAQSAAAPAQPAATPTQPAAAPASGWVKDHTGWYYLKADGTRASNEWLTLDSYDYWFDSNAYMATGWRQFSNGAWYFFKPGGAMEKADWVMDQGKWFYLDSDGVMLKSAKTPDGYLVDEFGVWAS